MTSPFSSILLLWYRLWRTPQSRHQSQSCCTGSFDGVYSIGGVSKNHDVIITSPFSSILVLWYRLWRTPQSRHRSQSWCTGSFDGVYLVGVVVCNRGVIVTSSFLTLILTSKRSQLRRYFPFITCMLTPDGARHQPHETLQSHTVGRVLLNGSVMAAGRVCKTSCAHVRTLHLCFTNS